MFRFLFDALGIACFLVAAGLYFAIVEQNKAVVTQDNAMMMMAQRNQNLQATINELVYSLEWLYNETQGGTCGRQSVDFWQDDIHLQADHGLWVLH